MPFDEAFLKETVEVWQPYSETPLALEDAREITENIVGFYGTLLRWAKEAAEGQRTHLTVK